jgi:demethylmenaquinone methyltransferase/2-methoxy-6-polyprenyl-1,4-benzoquinol methylase
MHTRIYFEPEYVRRRFNALASIYTLLDWVGLPRGMRAATARCMNLRPGDRVLEVGCGTGMNFPYLLKAIGPQGRLYGVDFSEGMLQQARRRCTRRSWENVVFIQSDATQYSLPEPVDVALFSLSIAVMLRYREALRQAWNVLRPGGRLVIMDAKTPSGTFGKLLHPFLVWGSRASVLGNPDQHPWEDLRELAGNLQMEERALGTYFICTATKQ